MIKKLDPSGLYELNNFKKMEFYHKYDIKKIDSKEIFTGRLFFRNKIFDLPEFKLFQNEYEILRSISHPLIQKFIELNYNAEEMISIVESEEINLLNYYKNDFPLSENISSIIFYYLIESLNYLHSLNIIHLNIRPDQIFIINNNFKLGGFYYSIKSNEDEVLTGNYGLINFQAPEIFLNSHFDGRKADIWASGIFLLTLLIGEIPFQIKNKNLTNEEKYEIIKNKILLNNLEIDKSLSNEVKDLLFQILQKDPSKRPNFSNLKDHIWLNKAKLFYESNLIGKMPNSISLN